MRETFFYLAAALVLVGCGGDVNSGAGGSGGDSSSSSSGNGSGGEGGAGSSSASSSSNASSSSSASSSGAGGAAAVGPECDGDEDCMIVNDCCICEGIPNGSTPPDCPISNCFAPTCESQGLPNPPSLCRAGRCVAGFDCDHSKVLCDSLPPVCPPGTTASVSKGCWGACVKATECASVSACTQCPTGQACIGLSGGAPTDYHCVDVPGACEGAIDCDCVGASSCVKPFGLCIETSPTELSCECPNC